MDGYSVDRSNDLIEAAVAAFTLQVFVAYLDEREQITAASTIEKERARCRERPDANRRRRASGQG